MPALRLLLSAFIVAATAACTSDLFGPPQPASFCNYPVSGKLESVSVADLEAVTTLVKPDKIYGVDIIGHDEIQVQITPRRHGSWTLRSFKREHGKWQPPPAGERIECIS